MDSQTPADPVSAHAVQVARAEAIAILEGYRLVSASMFRFLVGSQVLLIISQAAMWVYLLTHWR